MTHEQDERSQTWAHCLEQRCRRVTQELAEEAAGGAAAVIDLKGKRLHASMLPADLEKCIGNHAFSHQPPEFPVRLPTDEFAADPWKRERAGDPDPLIPSR
jgi:hypothetical protein